MYTLTKGKTTFLTKNFMRGTSQPSERLQIRDLDSRREQLDPTEMSSPKPVFNGRKNHTNSNATNSISNNVPNNKSVSQEPYPAQHEETVKFVSEAWAKIKQEYDSTKKQGKEGGPVYYQEKIAAPMRDFEPIDLDRWAVERTLEKLQLVKHSS